MKKFYKYLNNINFPSDLRKLKKDELKYVAKELREELIDAVSETGGHYRHHAGGGDLPLVAPRCCQQGRISRYVGFSTR